MLPPRRLISVDAYHMMIKQGFIREGERVELIQGDIWEMPNVGSEHSGKVNRINKRLSRLLDDELIIAVQNPVWLNDLSEPEPDISILKPRDDFYEKSHPTPQDVYLVIEVANTSLDFDKNRKLPLYAAAGIPEFWLVNLPAQKIEVYHTPLNNEYEFMESLRVGDQVHFRAFDLKIDAGLLLG